jgi:mono/diheme cytochrome c family protein
MKLFPLLGPLALIACAGAGAGRPSDAALSAARRAAPAGAKVFALRCGSCHGENGVAPGTPPVMGSRALRPRPGLENGRDLLRRLKATMPPGDDAGSLTDAEYLAVTEYLLRVQRLAIPAPFDASSAASVRLR